MLCSNGYLFCICVEPKFFRLSNKFLILDKDNSIKHKMQFLNCAFVLFLVNSGFPWSSPTNPIFAQSLTYYESWPLTISGISESCSSWDAIFGSFVAFWMSHWCALGVILVGWPLLERFTICLMMALTVFDWNAKALEMALYPFPDR